MVEVEKERRRTEKGSEKETKALHLNHFSVLIQQKKSIPGLIQGGLPKLCGAAARTFLRVATAAFEIVSFNAQ
jgi:hypothetical protein